MNGDGGIYIKRLIDDGALKEDFTIELLGIYPLKECLDREAELAKTSLFPKGLNGNAGSYIEMTEEVREKISKIAKKRIESGTHHFFGGDVQRKNNKKRVENGTHNLLGESNPTHKRIENGTHNFLDGEISRKTQKKRIENRTHHFLGPEINRNQVENGTHHLQVKGMLAALNIETNEVHRIQKDLYHSRRDIYFHPTSKVFKEWKKNH